MSEKSENQLSVFENAIRNFLKPIWNYLEDEKVTEIMINGHQEIFIEVGGKLQKTDAEFPSEDALVAAINNIAQSVGRTINEESPRLDARLPNGYRIHAVLPPCARNGTTVAIRKFSSEQMTLKDYVKLGSLNVEGAQFLDLCMKLGKNVLISGGTGSGKTTFLSALCNRIPDGQRIIIIEDCNELKVDYPHILYFETRMGNDKGLSPVGMLDLLKSSLRLRPDRIILGEVRGAEGLELIQAMNTGHKGCLGTIHANSSADALIRLEALAQGGNQSISEKALRMQLASAVDLVVQTARFPDGSRRVSEITEVLDLSEKGDYQTSTLFKMGRVKHRKGVLEARLEVTGEIPSFMDEIEDSGMPFSIEQFHKKAG